MSNAPDRRDRRRTAIARALRPVLLALVVVAALLSTGPGPVEASSVRSPEPHPARPTFRDQLERRSEARAGRATTGVMPYQTYTDWRWPTEALRSTQQTLTVNSAEFGSHYFWAHDFTLGSGGVGYVGLQIGSAFDHSRVALFSIWDADRTEGAKCQPFDGEGVGRSCRIDPFRWTEGGSYVLRVAVDGTDATGVWYRATVRDVSTGKTSVIGRIHHPFRGATIVGRGSWTEWFAPALPSCSLLKRSDVSWTKPVANNGTVGITSYWNHAEPKDDSTECVGSGHVRDQAGRVRHAIGPVTAK